MKNRPFCEDCGRKLGARKVFALIASSFPGLDKERCEYKLRCQRCYGERFDEWETKVYYAITRAGGSGHELDALRSLGREKWLKGRDK